jgi:sugar lactone lactonase YvrE
LIKKKDKLKMNDRKPVVSTYLTGSGLDRPDGFALDSWGNLYVANWGGGSGQTVLKITSPEGVTTLDFVFNAPDALIFDNVENLYVSNYNNGVISKITPEGVISDFATGLQNPSAMAFDRDGNLYVSNFGGKTVSKITPDGDVSIFATRFDAPLGLVFDSNGNLFVSDYATGIVFKVLPDGSSSVFATVPNPTSSKIQYLVLSESGNLYVPSYGHNQIYRITPEGVVTVFAGSGVAGTKDGPLDSAEFNGPNSIVISSDGTLFISEYNSNCIRVIRGVDL